MKKQNSFFALICVLLVIVSANPQDKSAVKFDEFITSSDNSYYPFEEINLSERIERFIKQIKKERGVNVYIIYYQPRVLYKGEIYRIGNLADYTKSKILYKTKLGNENILLANGGYRENPTLEYWIAPKNAEPPIPTPTFDKSEMFLCPRVHLFEDRLNFQETRLLDLYVPTYDINQTDDPNVDTRKLIYEWKITAGEIVEGEGTNRIKVKINDSKTKRITASVSVKGLSPVCENSAVLTAETENKAFLIDRAERYNFSDLAARIDSFIATLMQNPMVKGYVIVYADRNMGTRDMERGIKSVKNYIGYRGIDPNRITIVRGGFREYGMVDSWIIPSGAENPTPTPTVDKKFITPLIKNKRKIIRKK